MNIDWYLVVSALIFSIGAAGVLTRRNPLVVLLCLELMLNAANLALIAFARMWGNGDGQIFAIIVMVVAACEVVHRPRPRRRDVPPPPADRRRRDAGAARLDADEPPGSSCSSRCSGTIVIGLGFRVLAGAGRRAPSARSRSPRRSSRAVATFIALQDRGEEQRQVVFVAWDYANTVGVDAQLSILVDPLSVFMVLVVTGVSTLIHLYSVAYMAGDRGYARFFAYLNFFVFSMLLLVLAANFLLLIVGWAFVGAASYLLISFWYRRTTATTAGIKAFVINVVGDVGLVLGTFFIFRTRARSTSSARSTRPPGTSPGTRATLTAGLILLLVGAFAKSRPGPAAHVAPGRDGGPDPGLRADPRRDDGHRRRLPDRAHAPAVRAVGPRPPTSARSSAASRCWSPGRSASSSPTSSASSPTRRCRRSATWSWRVSAGAYVAGLFHLMTHAFFKALLFMAAGSVISAMAGEQTLDRMGGFSKAMPFTYACFVIGGLALAGVPPFSGFFSKDEILLVIGEHGGWHWVLYVVGYVGAFLTAIYTWRMIFRAFWGEPCPRRASSSRATSTTPRRPSTRPTARSRTPTSASPAPSTTSPSARCR